MPRIRVRIATRSHDILNVNSDQWHTMAKLAGEHGQIIDFLPAVDWDGKPSLMMLDYQAMNVEPGILDALPEHALRLIVTPEEEE